MKAEKPRKFEEPGFLIWLGAVRPKTFHVPGRPRVNQLWGFKDWFPAYNLKDPAAGIIPIGSDDTSLFNLATHPATAENWLLPPEFPRKNEKEPLQVRVNLREPLQRKLTEHQSVVSLKCP